MRKYFLLLGFLHCVFARLSAQDVINVINIVSASPDTRAITTTLPFDRPLLVKYTSTEPIAYEFVGLVQIKTADVKKYYEDYLAGSVAFQDISTPGYAITRLAAQTVIGQAGGNLTYNLTIVVPPLKPNSFYDIIILRHPLNFEAGEYFELFQIYHDDGETVTPAFRTKLKQINTIKKPFSHLAGTSVASQAHQALLTEFYRRELKSLYGQLQTTKDKEGIEKIKSQIVTKIKTHDEPVGVEHVLTFGQSLSLTTTAFSFDTRTTFSLTPDFGYVYYGWQNSFHGITPYLGLQVEFRYFDKNYPFWLIRNKSIWHYLSFTAGITLSSLKKENRREDLFSGKSLLLGLGIRLTNATRITVGGIVFNREDPTPYKDHKRTGMTPFLGLSIDLKLKSILNDFTGLSTLNRR